jgi:hypothetical protein
VLPAGPPFGAQPLPKSSRAGSPQSEADPPDALGANPSSLGPVVAEASCSLILHSFACRFGDAAAPLVPIHDPTRRTDCAGARDLDPPGIDTSGAARSNVASPCAQTCGGFAMFVVHQSHERHAGNVGIEARREDQVGQSRRASRDRLSGWTVNRRASCRNFVALRLASSQHTLPLQFAEMGDVD